VVKVPPIVFVLFDYLIKSKLLWGVRPLSSYGYAWEITDPHMKVVFYSYLSQYNRIVEEFLYGKPKPDIWEVLPSAKLLGEIEVPVPHLSYRNLELPPFTDDLLVLLFVDWDLYDYSRMSSARRAVRRLVEPYMDKIRDDYLNLFIIDVRRGVEESLGEILSGLVLRSLGFVVDITGNPGHGVYLPARVSRKYPDVMAWRTEETMLLQEEGILECGAFLPELSVISLYGRPPCYEAKQNLEVELPDSGDLILAGEIEPSAARIHGGLRQVEVYENLGYSDVTFIAAPEACRRTSNTTSCIDLQPPLKTRLLLGGKTIRENKDFLKYILEFMTRSTLLLNFSPGDVTKQLEEWHEIISLPSQIEIKELIKFLNNIN
jgi:hypothetical protein